MTFSDDDLAEYKKSLDMDGISNPRLVALKQVYSVFPSHKAVEALLDLIEECSVKNWDGYNAEPLSKPVILKALGLIDQFPEWTPIPDLVPHPSGSLAFEWRKNDRAILILSVGTNLALNYAVAIKDTVNLYGTENLYDSIPEIVLEFLKKHF